MVSELMLSARAPTWFTSTMIPRCGSPAVMLTSRVRPSASARVAISRTFASSGPVTRNLSGQPTGGPSSSGETRVVMWEKSRGNALLHAGPDRVALGRDVPWLRKKPCADEGRRHPAPAAPQADGQDQDFEASGTGDRAALGAGRDQRRTATALVAA